MPGLYRMLQPLVATEFVDMFAGPLSFLPPIEISAARKIRGAFMNLVDLCGRRIAHRMSRAAHSRQPYGLGLKADVCPRTVYRNQNHVPARGGRAKQHWPDDATPTTGSIFASFVSIARRSHACRSTSPTPRPHRQPDAPSCLAFAISALALTSLMFRFALPRLQKARALLGSSRIATLKSAMARL